MQNLCPGSTKNAFSDRFTLKRVLWDKGDRPKQAARAVFGQNRLKITPKAPKKVEKW
nr:MAG TPA: hypothetical protein [Caudoviricetes sp.]